MLDFLIWLAVIAAMFAVFLRRRLAAAMLAVFVVAAFSFTVTVGGELHVRDGHPCRGAACTAP